MCPVGSRAYTRPRMWPGATPPSPLTPLLEGASVLLPLALCPVVEKRGLQKEYGSCCHHLYQQGAPSLRGKGRTIGQGGWEGELGGSPPPTPHLSCFSAAVWQDIQVRVCNKKGRPWEELRGMVPQTCFHEIRNRAGCPRVSATNVGLRSPLLVSQWNPRAVYCTGVRQWPWPHFLNTYLPARNNKKAFSDTASKFITLKGTFKIIFPKCHLLWPSNKQNEVPSLLRNSPFWGLSMHPISPVSHMQPSALLRWLGPTF